MTEEQRQQRLHYELTVIAKDLLDHFEAIEAGRMPFPAHSAALLRRIRFILSEKPGFLHEHDDG
jgi:hypothetical protein